MSEEDISISESFEVKDQAISVSNDFAKALVELRTPFLCLISLPTGEILRMSAGTSDTTRNIEMLNECLQYLEKMRSDPEKN